MGCQRGSEQQLESQGAVDNRAAAQLLIGAGPQDQGGGHADVVHGIRREGHQQIRPAIHEVTGLDRHGVDHGESRPHGGAVVGAAEYEAGQRLDDHRDPPVGRSLPCRLQECLGGLDTAGECRHAHLAGDHHRRKRVPRPGIRGRRPGAQHPVRIINARRDHGGLGDEVAHERPPRGGGRFG